MHSARATGRTHIAGFAARLSYTPQVDAAIRKMCQNAFTYNAEDHDVHKSARNVLAHWDDLWKSRGVAELWAAAQDPVRHVRPYGPLWGVSAAVVTVLAGGRGVGGRRTVRGRVSSLWRERERERGTQCARGVLKRRGERGAVSGRAARTAGPAVGQGSPRGAIHDIWKLTPSRVPPYMSHTPPPRANLFPDLLSKPAPLSLTAAPADAARA